tara:strand:+ start:74 stop:286 length:213 start_codon:yes stop_codon:yes gene_type:complete
MKPALLLRSLELEPRCAPAGAERPVASAKAAAVTHREVAQPVTIGLEELNLLATALSSLDDVVARARLLL